MGKKIWLLSLLCFVELSVYAASYSQPSKGPESYGPAPVQQSTPIQQPFSPPPTAAPATPVSPTTPTTPPPAGQPTRPLSPPSSLGPPRKSSLTLELNPSAVYSEPGIATFQNGQWVGTEHLYGVPSTIGVVLDVIRPPGATIPISDNEIREKIGAIFRKGHITERQPLMKGSTPLPFFHMIIIIQPIEKGYVAYVEGRLYEEAQMKRVELKSNIVWQVLTWEKQELVMFPTEQLKSQIEQSVQDIANAFVERFNSYPPSDRTPVQR